MAFDPSTAQLADSGGFDPSTAVEFNPDTATAIPEKSSGGTGKYVVNTATDLMDMVLGAPAFIAERGAQASSRAIGQLAGQTQAEIEAGSQDIANKFAPWEKPLAGFEQGVGYSRGTGSAVERVMEPISQGAEKVVSSGESIGVPSGVTQELLNQGMAFAPLGFKGARTDLTKPAPVTPDTAVKIGEALKTGASKEQIADAILKQAAEKGIDTSLITKQHIVDTIDDVKAHYEEVAKAAEKPAETPTAPKVTASEGSEILNAVVQGMRRSAGERRVEDNPQLQGVKDDRRIAEVLRRKAASLNPDEPIAPAQDVPLKGLKEDRLLAEKMRQREAGKTQEPVAPIQEEPKAPVQEPSVAEQAQSTPPVSQEVKVLPSGKIGVSGFTKEQVSAVRDKLGVKGAQIGENGNSTFPEDVSPIAIRRALGIDTLPKDTILNKGDTPFVKKGAAVIYRNENKLKNSHDVIKIEGGYALAPKEAGRTGQAFGQRGAVGDLTSPQEKFAKDMQQQSKDLGRVAQSHGYDSVDTFATKEPEAFNKAAQDWRTQHNSEVTPEALAQFSKQRNEIIHTKMNAEAAARGHFFWQRGAVGDLNSGIAKAKTEQDVQVYRLQSKHGGSREEAIQDYFEGKRVSDPEYKKLLSQNNYFNKQRGTLDPKLAAATGLSIAGALAGMYIKPDQKIEGLIGGAIFGFALATLPHMSSVISRNWKAALQDGKGSLTVGKVAKHVGTGAAFAAGGAFLSDPEHPVEGALLGSVLFGLRFLPKKGAHSEEELFHAYNGNRAAEDRLILQRKAAMIEAVPDKAAREYLSEAAEKPGAVWRNDKEKLVIEAHRGITENSYKAMQQFPSIKVGFIDNFVHHVMEAKGVPQSEFGRIMSEVLGPEKGTGGVSRFTKERTYATFAELRAATQSAFRIKTMDIAEIDEIYQRSVTRTIEQHRLVQGLINAVDHYGKPADYVVKDKQLGYVQIPHPILSFANRVFSKVPEFDKPQLEHTQQQGYWIHPDVADSLRFVFDPKNHARPAEALFALNRATKRMNVFGTFFHGASLLTSYALTGGNIFKARGDLDASIALWKNGGLGDRLDRGVRNGLRVPTPDEASIGALQSAGEMADIFVNKMLGTDTRVLGKIAGAAEDFQKKTFDKATWDHIGVGSKVSTFMRLMEEFDLGKDASGKYMEHTEDQYMQAVASHVNKSFGGLDWYRIATEAKTEAGRKVAMWMLKPSTRDWLGVLYFAPDWGVATFRAMADALPGGSTNPVNTMLARRYVMRTAVLYATFLNGLNYALSGHFMWDNKEHGVDPLRIDIGNGTSVQFLKHAMEYPEWIISPTKTFSNKLGFIPKGINIAEYGTQYPGGPPITGSKLGAIASGAAPFTARSFAGEPDVTEGLTRSLLGIMSINIYGHTDEAKAQMKEERAASNSAKKKGTKSDL